MKGQFIPTFRKLIKHELISGSFFVFTGGMIGSLLNFLFNLFIIRKLSHGDYGVYAAVISLVALISIPAQAITPIIVRFSTEYFAKNELGKAKRFYRQSSILLFVLGFIIAFTLVLFSPFVNSFFQLNNIIFVLLAGLLVLVGYVSVVNGSYLQSLLKFRVVALINVVNSVGKIVIGGAFVLLGFKVFGALGGVIVGGIIAFILSILPLMDILKVDKEVPVNSHTKEIGMYGILAAISMFSITSFTSSDILLVKHFFSPTDAGLYAGLSLVGKIIFYFSSPIITVTFPVLLNRFHRGQKMNSVLYLSVLLVFLPSLFLSILYTLFPTFFINIFLGGKGFLQMSRYVGLYGLYIAVFSVVNVLTTYFLSIQYKKALYLVGIAAIAQVVGIIFLHSTFQEVINVLVSIIIITAIVLSFLLIRNTKRI